MTPCYVPQTEIPTENFLFPIQLEFEYANLLRFSVPLKHTSVRPEQRLYPLCQTQVPSKAGAQFPQPEHPLPWSETGFFPIRPECLLAQSLRLSHKSGTLVKSIWFLQKMGVGRGKHNSYTEM